MVFKLLQILTAKNTNLNFERKQKTKNALTENVSC